MIEPILTVRQWTLWSRDMEKALRLWARHPVVAPWYSMARGIRNVLQYKKDDDEWGFCNICGRYTCFAYHDLIATDSEYARSCEWDADFTRVINASNTLDCSWCLSKFRVRSATDVLLKTFRSQKYRDLKQLTSDLRVANKGWQALETASSGGIFSSLDSCPFVIKSEYFNDVPRGHMHQGVRSEDLQELTFADNSFDIVVSLDVFEHVANPWKAFQEVLRVLKPQGSAIITIPIDKRLKETKVRAEWDGQNLIHHSRAAYHLDPLRAEGALVFTDFGLDIAKRLLEQNIPARLEVYKTQKRKIEQYVLVLEKK